ncbi:N-acetyltransferase 10 [Chamberlinius hualienensis]
MVRKKLDNRIRVMIENGVISGHRSMFVIVGDRARDQVVILHHMLSKTAVKARPSVLWCYKKELGFSSHRKKRMKQLQKKIQHGKLDVNEEDPFELFIASTTIRYCYYSETHKILGNTFGMCVLQDFEAMTPNLLARTIETVEGGGIIVILLKSMNSLKQLYTMSMDVHKRYRTEAHQDVVGRFNERFILSLATCKTCVVMDDQLNVVPFSSHITNVNPLPPKSCEDPLSEEEQELKDLKESLQDTQPVGVLINCCRTKDQPQEVAENRLHWFLSIAGAVAFGYSNIFVTSPSPENLNTLFEFIFKGFDVLEYQEHLDYEVVQSTNPEFNKAVIRVNIFRDHRQTIQYIHPTDAVKLGQAELVIIDEAAAIPLPLVKSLLGPYLVFMSSTINGYEGTGRSLSLKLISQLRQQTIPSDTVAAKKSDSTSVASITGRTLQELQLNESIRYKNGDPVESWLNSLLCLDATLVSFLQSGCPDTLFSFHSASEAFLQRLMSLYVASHYKNSPNDLQMLSDAPAHLLFCLLGPVTPGSKVLPEVLCVLQVCLEGEISKSSIMSSLSRGQRASGDLIPWTISQQFQDNDFPRLSGARVIRIATHPNYQRMGYGVRAISLLQQYFEGKIPVIDNDDVSNDFNTVSQGLPPLLLKLSQRPAERLDYIGVSYGLTPDLLKFWKKTGFVPVYLRQTANDLTGEHSCIMLKPTYLSNSSWLTAFSQDFSRRFVSLLSFQFRSFSPSLAVSILTNPNISQEDGKTKPLTTDELDVHLTKYDLKRLELYSNNMVDYHLVTDLLPVIARMWCLRRLQIELRPLEKAILVGMGLQHKTADDLAKELELPTTQLLGVFNRIIRKMTNFLSGVVQEVIASTMPEPKRVELEPTALSLDKDLDDGAKKVEAKQKKEKRLLLNENLQEYAIKGTEDEWKKVLSAQDSIKTSVNLKSEKRKAEPEKNKLSFEKPKQKKKFKKHK